MNFFRTTDTTDTTDTTIWKPGLRGPIVPLVCGFIKRHNLQVWRELIKPGFHIVVSVVSVVRKKFIGQIKLTPSRTTSCICRFYCIEHLYGRFP